MHKIILQPNAKLAKDSTIFIGGGILSEIGSLYDLKQYSKVFVVTDEGVAPLLLDPLLSVLPAGSGSIVLPNGEQQKNIEGVQKIWTAMHDAKCDRKSVVINLGGGVIGDIGGFAASTYMRGLEFLNVPTTLLSQVDAGIGGKNGFNFSGIKNLIGTFNQPIGIMIDPRTLGSVPEREFLSGFAEIIKHGLIWDKAYFKQVTSKKPLDYTQKELTDIIARSCQIKADIVQSDTNEEGVRKLVNFGHTVGHALEALSLNLDTPMVHGEAISIGMIVEADISQRMDLLPSTDLPTIKQAFVDAGLPVNTQVSSIASVQEKMKSDKKNENGNVNFTLLTGIGHAVFNQRVDESVVSASLQAHISESP